jgi:peptidoglycan/xylan/chitin deacetylase (PgdA/CDA1 family)
MSRLIVTTSWDDGGKEDLRLSELLAKYGVRGTFYIPKSHQKAEPLREEEILAVAEEHEIGAHTLGHVDLTGIPTEQAQAEIAGSKAYLENILGKGVRMFCYPYGRYNARTKEIVVSCGFAGARSLSYTKLRTVTDPYEIGVTLHASDSSPRTTLRIWRAYGMPLRFLLDWETRAKSLFQLALTEGGVWHLWGHSWEINRRRDWDKLERVLDCISKRDGVQYATNSEAVDTCLAGTGQVPHGT